MTSSQPSRLAKLARATPADRERYVDCLRAVSIGVVVFGHWLMAVVYWDDGSFTGANALDLIPGIWLLTWVLQVMPVFFFVGGFANALNLRRKPAYGAFLRGRLERLLRPTLIFIGVWLLLAIVLRATVSGGEQIAEATSVLAKPIWFLAVYLLAIALAPAMFRLHNRFGVGVPVFLTAAAAIVDLIRLGLDVEPVGYLNFLFVWLFPHQLGFFYADGSLMRSRMILWVMTIGGLVALALLTAAGPYSPSMVGITTEKASNNSPPSVCLIALSLWLVGLAMLLRDRVSTLLQRERPWMAVIAANSAIMTVFLWHLTALFVAVAALYPLGFPQPQAGTGGWWLTRPVWLLALAAILAIFVRLFARFERPLSRPEPLEPSPPRAAVATGLVFASLALFAQFGLDVAGSHDGWPLAPPIIATVLLGAGVALLSLGAVAGRGRPAI